MQYGIFGFDGVHVINLNQISLVIKNLIAEKIIVQSNIDEMNDRIGNESDEQCGTDALYIPFDKSKTEHQNRDTDFQ